MKRFRAAYGEPTKYADVDSSLFAKYSFLPRELLEEWKRHGFSVYQKGLLWFTNPDEFEDTVAALFGKHCDYRCIARTAFGDLILFDKDDRWLDFSAPTLRATDYQASYFTFFDFMMSGKNWLRDVMRISLYKKALKKLGPLQSKEVYAFEPHPALGGSAELDTLKKRQLREYLAILAELRDK
jgi:hypothetical protein